MTSQPIAGHVVGRYLRVNSQTLDDWHKTGFLSCASESRRCHNEADLNAFLAVNACNFDKIPTFADLVAKKVVLLTAKEAADILGLSTACMPTLVAAGRLAVIKYRYELRYCQTSVKKYAAAPDELTGDQAARVFGFGWTRGLSSFVAQGKLVKTLKGRYSTESALTLLRELLPPHQSPQDWLEDRLTTNRPLLSMHRAVADRYQRERITKQMDSGVISFINLPKVTASGNRRLICPDSLLAYLENNEQAHTKEQLEQIFGVTPESLDNWDERYRGWWECPLHDHNDDSLYRDCVISVLQKYLTPGTSAVTWYNTWRKSEEPPLTTSQTAELLGVTRRTVLRWVQTGRLAALHTPGGNLRFLRSNVVSPRKKHTRREVARSE